jgi:MFS family permease
MTLVRNPVPTSHDIPHGIRTITIATGIRWFGWGLAESLIPVFIFSFAHNYAITGLIGSTYDFAFILALPMAGIAADIFPATALIALSLALYPLVGLSYFLAGALGLVVFVVLARLTNGVLYSLDYVGRETYFRRHVEKARLATVLGYFDSIANLWWIVAALMSLALIRYVSISVLLLMIAPTSILSLIVVLRLRKNDPELTPRPSRSKLSGSYGAAVREIQSWSLTLKGLAVFNFFIALAGTVTAVFLPIEAHLEGASLVQVILIGVFFAVPPLLGWFLGRWFDLKGQSIFPYGLFAFAILLGSLGFMDTYIWKLFAALGVGVILELLTLGSGELVTVCALPEHFGRVGGIIEGVSDLGGLVGPLAVGILIDVEGAQRAFGYVGITMGLLAVTCLIMTRALQRDVFRSAN